MRDIAQAAMLLAMVQELRGHGSWSGETHLQKAMYFLDKRCNKATGFDFVLYKHGPYSFDLHDTLSLLFAHCLLEHEISPPYGPRIRLTESGQKFLAQHCGHIAEAKPATSHVAAWFGDKGVSALEKLATALWVRQEEPTAADEHLAARITSIKPHINQEEALSALSALNAFPPVPA